MPVPSILGPSLGAACRLAVGTTSLAPVRLPTARCWFLSQHRPSRLPGPAARAAAGCEARVPKGWMGSACSSRHPAAGAWRCSALSRFPLLWVGVVLGKAMPQDFLPRFCRAGGTDHVPGSPCCHRAGGSGSLSLGATGCPCIEPDLTSSETSPSNSRSSSPQLLF